MELRVVELREVKVVVVELRVTEPEIRSQVRLITYYNNPGRPGRVNRYYLFLMAGDVANTAFCSRYCL